MQTIDLSVYHTLAKSLVLQQDHPYKAKHTSFAQDYDSNRLQYRTVKKTLKMMTIKQQTTNKQEHTGMIETINQQAESPDHYSQKFERFNTGDLLKQPQLSEVHPLSKEGIVQEQPFLESCKIKKISSMCDMVHVQIDNKITNGIKMEDVILGPSNIPIKKENYYENVKQAKRNMQISGQRYKLKDFKRYPIIFIANLFVLLTLPLAISLNDQIIWIIESGFIFVYLLIIYLSKVRKEMFGIKKIDGLQILLRHITNLQGHFKLQIQCYHYAKIKNRTEKVVTFKKTQLFKPSISLDQSFSLNDIDSKSTYIAISPHSNFYFVDQQSQDQFSSIFNEFVERSINDFHQKYSYSLEIESLKDLQGLYCPTRSYCYIFYIIFAIIGLLYPFLIWQQSNTVRYEANIIKKVTIQP